MAKVWCAETECKHYSEEGCTADEINISAGHIHSTHNGFMHHWECNTFEMSQEAKEIFSMLKAYFDRLDRQENQ